MQKSHQSPQERQQEPEPLYWRLKQVAAALNTTPTSFTRHERYAPDFPKPIKGPLRWPVEAVKEYVRNKSL